MRMRLDVSGSYFSLAAVAGERVAEQHHLMSWGPTGEDAGRRGSQQEHSALPERVQPLLLPLSAASRLQPQPFSVGSPPMTDSSGSFQAFGTGLGLLKLSAFWIKYLLVSVSVLYS